MLLLGVATGAQAASLTAFLQGASPGGRPGVGFALSIPVFTEVISLEGEYARARKEEGGSPSFTFLSGNLLIVSPAEILRLRPYFVAGLGLYRQSLESARETSIGTTEGLGVFLRLAGPLHARLDYRTIQLRGNPLEENQKRFYGGLSLRF